MMLSGLMKLAFEEAENGESAAILIEPNLKSSHGYEADLKVESLEAPNNGNEPDFGESDGQTYGCFSRN